MQTTETTLKQLLSLTETEHISAAEQAKNMIKKKAGKRPERSTYEDEHVPRYPKQMTYILLVLMSIPLVASFLVSAFRLYDIGYDTYFESIPDSVQATIAGITIVLVAEIGMILFSVFPTVFPEKEKPEPDELNWWERIVSAIPRPNPYDAYVLLCLAVTLVGNIHVAHPQELAAAGNWFGYIEATVPTLVVIGISWGLKRMILHYLAERQRVTKAYKTALTEWKLVTDFPEQSAEYDLQFRKALLKKIKDKNARSTRERKIILNAIQPLHEQWLLWNELQRDQIALTGIVEPFPHVLPPLPHLDIGEVATEDVNFIQSQIQGKSYDNGHGKQDQLTDAST